MKRAIQSNRSCPYLGLPDDAKTSSAFASLSNTCYRSVPIATPRFKHQQEFCLTGKHTECPLFTGQQAMPMPEEFRIPAVPRDDSRKNIVITIAVASVLLIFGWGLTRRGLSVPVSVEVSRTTTPSATPSKTQMISFLAPLTMTTIPISTRTPISNETTTAVNTPSLPPTKHQYDVLIGTDYKFVIHIVKAGENLDLLAARYDTNVEAIITINYFLNNPGWSGTQLVIPVGVADVSSLPSFVVYQVTEKDRGTSIEDLAKILKVSTMDLKYYNGWTSPGDRPIVGDLLLVPKHRPMQ